MKKLRKWSLPGLVWVVEDSHKPGWVRIRAPSERVLKDFLLRHLGTTDFPSERGDFWEARMAREDYDAGVSSARVFQREMDRATEAAKAARKLRRLANKAAIKAAREAIEASKPSRYETLDLGEGKKVEEDEVEASNRYDLDF